MKKFLALSAAFSITPFITYAQVGSFQSMFGNIITFVDRALIPFLFGMAFLFFVINVFRYFILGGSNPEAQDSAKSLATYSVAAFVFLIIFWGIVNMIINSIGINSTPVRSDYVGVGGSAGMVSMGSGGSGSTQQTFPEDNDAGYALPGQYQQRDI